MKEFDYEKVMTVKVKKATCDDCGSDCTNSYFDILIKPSFSDRSDFIKTVCWKCYEKIKQHRKGVRINDDMVLFKRLKGRARKK